MAIIQCRVDDDLKKKASIVYLKLGIDLSTAIRMFLKRSVMVNGIPFPMTIEEEPNDASRGIQALEEGQKIAEANGNSEMTLDEINLIIHKTRKEKKG